MQSLYNVLPLYTLFCDTLMFLYQLVSTFDRNYCCFVTAFIVEVQLSPCSCRLCHQLLFKCSGLKLRIITSGSSAGVVLLLLLKTMANILTTFVSLT